MVQSINHQKEFLFPKLATGFFSDSFQTISFTVAFICSYPYFNAAGGTYPQGFFSLLDSSGSFTKRIV